MSESRMRARLVRLLRPLDAIAVENGGACPGTPDVNYIGGWIECKWRRTWPRFDKERVALQHPITPQQRVWLERRLRRGGLAWVMFECGGDWLLFRGDVACRMLGAATRPELVMAATRFWAAGKFDRGELIEALRE